MGYRSAGHAAVKAIRAAAWALRVELTRARLSLRSVIDPKPDKYPTLRSVLYEEVYEAVSGYLSSGGPVTSYRNRMRKAVEEYFLLGFYRGYVDAGAEEVEDEDEDWVAESIADQVDFIYGLFDSLKVLRDNGVDSSAEGEARATAWAGTMDGIYGEGKFRGDGNKMLTMKRDPDAPESIADPCATCQRWRGKRRSAKKWRADGLIARNGNDAYECGRWEGACYDEFYDDSGRKYSA